MRRYLIVANQTLNSDHLFDVIADLVGQGPSRVLSIRMASQSEPLARREILSSAVDSDRPLRMTCLVSRTSDISWGWR